MASFLAGLAKLAIACLIVGAGLGLFGVTLTDVMTATGLTPERLSAAWDMAVEWSLPRLGLGAVVVLPIWFAVFLFRPPGGAGRD